MKSKHVVYVSDANQADILSVSLFSLLKHLSVRNEVVVHVLWAGREFSEAERGRVLDACRRCDFRQIEFHDINGYFEERADLIRGKMVWGRFFFELFVDETEGNVLYLDTDTLVREDISELFSLDLGQDLVAAVSEAQFVSARERQVDHACKFLPPDVWRYFNGGVLVFNLKLIREEKLVEKVFEWYSEHQDVATFLDQDSLNAVVAGRVRFLHPKYNYNDGWLERQCRYSTDAEFWRGCRPAEVLEAILHPSVCHYIGKNRKPWNYSHRPERAAYHACMRELGLALPKRHLWDFVYDIWHCLLKKVVVPFRLARARR